MNGLKPTLKQLVITPRTGSESYIYEIQNTPDCLTKPTQESLTSNIEDSYKSWSYESVSEFAPATTVLYIPWKLDTYVVVFERNEGDIKSRGLFHFSSSQNTVIDIKDIKITNYANTQDDANNKYVQDSKYGEYDVYQVDKFVLYDIPTSNLIIRKEHNTGSIDIHNSLGDIITPEKVSEQYENNKTHENQEKHSELKAWTAVDGQGENVVVYVKNKESTLVCVLGYDSTTMSSLILKNVKRFTLYGVDNGDKVEKPTAACNKKSESPEEKKSEGPEESKSDDYILKTEIVPNACPSCPSCPSLPEKITCTNCGGCGGSGTVGSDGKSLVKDTVDAAGNIVTDVVDEAGDIARDTVGGAVGLGKDTVGGAVGLGKDAVGGAVGLGKDAVGGAVGLGREIVGGALGLGREIVGGAVGLGGDVLGGAVDIVRDAGTGAVRMIPKDQRNQNGRPNMQGAYYGTNNDYNYNGTLANKPSSNFMPVTADFSSFAH